MSFAEAMQAGSEEWKAFLIQEAGRAGIALDALQADRMAAHAAALLEWNRTINLTSITDPVEIAVKHFLDSILPLPHIPSGPPLLDIGSGAGFPGLPLKIMRPEQSMTLLDGSRRKINFVKHVLRRLNLPHAAALQARAEDLGARAAHRGSFGVIVCRALADPETIARWAAPLLHPQGAVYLYEGPGRGTVQSGAGYRVIASFEYALPLLGGRRTLRVIRPHRPR